VSGVIGELGLGFFAAPTSLLTGKVVKTTDALGKGTYVLSDRFGRQSATYDATKHRTSASLYDAVDRLIAATDTFGQITSYSYNDALNKTTIVDPYGGSSYELTDAVGNLIEEIDPLGRSDRYSYDKRNRKIQAIDPKGGFTLYTYTTDDLTKSIRDAVGNTTNYTYDITGRLTAEQTASGTRSYTYDAVDNRTSATDRNGRMINYSYDNLDRLKSETWVGNGQQFIYTYDKNGNRLTALDGTIKYVYSYDYTDLLETVDRQQAGNPTVSFKYGYDDVGNLTSAEESIANNIQATTIYEYNDPRYLNTKIHQDGVDLVTKDVKFTYDAKGLNTTVERYVDGLLKVDTINAYDVYGRLTGIEHHRGGVTLGSSSYVIDDLDRLQSETKDSQSRTIGYDSIDQVATVTGSNSEAYTYDKNGNRTNNGYATGDDNRLLSDGVYTYKYDQEGNRTKRTRLADSTVDDYTWDYRNRLVSIVTTAAGGAVLGMVEYEYDVDDQRVRKTVTSALPTGGVVENYFIDRDQIAFVTDGSGNETFHYLYGLNVDAVMAQDSPAGMVWSLADRLGSIDTLTDKDGNVVDKRSFDSFGRVLSQMNPSVSFRYGYTARERDLESGLSYYRARYYDPQVGRFISVDPMGFEAGDTNLYRYVGNSSTLATDPSGMWSLEEAWNSAQQTWNNGVRTLQQGLNNTGQAIVNGSVSFRNTVTSNAQAGLEYWSKVAVAGQNEGGIIGGAKQFVGTGFGLLSSLATEDNIDKTSLVLAASLGLARVPLKAPLLTTSGGGFIAGTGASTIKQGLEIAEGSRDKFSIGEALRSGIGGAIAAPLLVYAPELAVPLAIKGVAEGSYNVTHGRPLSGAFDIVTSLLPFASTKVRNQTMGEGTLFGQLRGLGNSASKADRAARLTDIEAFDAFHGITAEYQVSSFKLARGANRNQIIGELPQAAFGHVGFSFNSGKKIYGFGPVTGSMSPAQAYTALRARQQFDGILTNDTAMFAKARTLGLNVIEQKHNVGLLRYWTARTQARIQETFGTPANTKYMFPPKPAGTPFPANCYNCATYPGQMLNLPSSSTGYLSNDY
jgi:RHS repeat-associated protein